MVMVLNPVEELEGSAPVIAVRREGLTDCVGVEIESFGLRLKWVVVIVIPNGFGGERMSCCRRR